MQTIKYTQSSRFLGEAASKRIPRSAHLVHDWGERAQPTKPKIRMRRVYITLLGLFAFAPVILAKNQELQINLRSFEVVHPQEKHGDELYISITEFPKNNLPKSYKVPPFPSHWLSQYLNSFKEVTLWRKNFDECEPLELLITLVEEDAQPWDPDDSLGSVKLEISCVNGKLKEKWDIPNTEKVSKITEKKNAFHFKGGNSQYNIQFSLDSATVKPLEKIKTKEVDQNVKP